jgi:hypothetical protein
MSILFYKPKKLNIMKKVSIFFVALFVCALVVSSCKSGASNAKNDSVPAAAADTTQTVPADTTQVK